MAFLNDALAGKEFELIPLAGDASARRYFRVIQDQKSWVLMSWEPFKDPNEYPFLSVLRHFKKHKVKVPSVQRVGAESGLILLEDLGDLTLERKFWENQDPASSLPFYFQAVDELIKIHYPASEDHQATCTAFAIEFDHDKLLWEMNYAKQHLLENLCDLEFSAAVSKSMTDLFSGICQKLASQPKRICHRDYHSRNLMLKLGQMRVIDFQDARLGPIQYDLVSLVHDSYVKLDHQSQQKILEDYLDKAHSFGLITSRDEFDEVFQLQVIQRCFKACGSFASFYNQRGDTRYLKYIQPTLLKVFDYLSGYSEMATFADLIKSEGLLERDFQFTQGMPV